MQFLQRGELERVQAGVRRHQRPSRPGRAVVRAQWSSAKRQAKDPARFGSMDELRESLHSQAQASGPSLSGLLNWLSDASFGAPRSASSTGAGPAAHEDPGPLPALYRWITQNGLWARRRRQLRRTLQFSQLNAEQQSQVRQLATVLACSEASVLRMASLHPEVLAMSPHDVLQRLLGLKSVLPGVDVLIMVETAPQQLLSGRQEALERQVGAAEAVLRAGLAGADLRRMYELDPAILLEPTDALRTGLHHMRELWDVDEQALANSDPCELALAIRALATRAPRAF